MSLTGRWDWGQGYRTGKQFEVVAAGIGEVHTAAAEEVIDGTLVGVSGVGPVRQSLGPKDGYTPVEGVVGDEDCEMKGLVMVG